MTEEERLRNDIATLRKQHQRDREVAKPYMDFCEEIAVALGADRSKPMAVSQVRNLSVKYIAMGRHFDTLMRAIQADEALQNEWENLMILLKLSESGEE